mmetsp:Transcript_127717/g.367609  ORF Transcript_127717/g.367609 Transcript_127717/m.367609 type:complete len:327 (-) Transcript_127717:1685-2665(-)
MGLEATEYNLALFSGRWLKNSSSGMRCAKLGQAWNKSAHRRDGAGAGAPSSAFRATGWARRTNLPASAASVASGHSAAAAVSDTVSPNPAQRLNTRRIVVRRPSSLWTSGNSCLGTGLPSTGRTVNTSSGSKRRAAQMPGMRPANCAPCGMTARWSPAEYGMHVPKARRTRAMPGAAEAAQALGSPTRASTPMAAALTKRSRGGSRSPWSMRSSNKCPFTASASSVRTTSTRKGAPSRADPKLARRTAACDMTEPTRAMEALLALARPQPAVAVGESKPTTESSQASKKACRPPNSSHRPGGQSCRPPFAERTASNFVAAPQNSLY